MMLPSKKILSLNTPVVGGKRFMWDLKMMQVRGWRGGGEGGGGGGNTTTLIRLKYTLLSYMRHFFHWVEAAVQMDFYIPFIPPIFLTLLSVRMRWCNSVQIALH